MVGPGSVGSLLAAKLAQNLGGDEIVLAGRGAPSPATEAHLAAAAEQGIEVSGEESFTARPEVSRGPGGGPADALLLAVKADQAAEAARAFSPLLKPATLVGLLPNGLGLAADLPPGYPRERTVRGLVHSGAERIAPGRVRMAGAPALVLAPAFGGETGAAEALAGILREGGIRAEVRAGGGEEEWRKAAANLVINPLGAVLGLRNGELLEVEEARALFETLAGEVQPVAEAEGAALDVLALAREAARATAGNRNSMWQDLRAGRKTEVEALTGRFLALAKKHGLPAPANEMLRLSVKAMEGRKR